MGGRVLHRDAGRCVKAFAGAQKLEIELREKRIAELEEEVAKLREALTMQATDHKAALRKIPLLS